MTAIGIIFAVLAIGLHFFIFYLESFAWTSRARAIFGTTEAEAIATKEMAFNQGFYNLFLALIAFVGVLAYLMGSLQVGIALMLAGVGSMLAAALLLFFTSPDKRGAALKQGIFPALSIFLFLVELI